MKSDSINLTMQSLIKKIETQSTLSTPRGLAVKELELETLNLDPAFTLADFEARPFNWKYFMGELAWYMKKDRNIEFINNFSSFWKNIADSNGDICSNYGNLLFGTQLQWALDSLRKDPNTRQAIAFVSRPSVQFTGNKDFVCTIYLNFWIRDNRLNMKVQMRSNDVFYGLTYDAPFFSFVQQQMWQWLRETNNELHLGRYYHCADNIHFYERHFDIAKAIIEEEPKNPYFFLLREPLFTLENDQMILTPKGQDFLNEVDQLVNSQTKITQELSKQTLSKYFFIQ